MTKAKGVAVIETYPMVAKCNDFSQTENMCYRITNYLVSGGSNDLAKLIYYDTANPLSEVAPQRDKLVKLIYNPELPTSPTSDKGYRIFQQRRISEAQEEMKTELRIFPLRARATTWKQSLTGQFHVGFQCMTGMRYESLTGGLSRTWQMCICIAKALAGRSIGGLGGMQVISIDPNINDNHFNIGYTLIMGVEVGSNEREKGCTV